MLEILVKKLAEEAVPFTKGGPLEAGWDIYCIADHDFRLNEFVRQEDNIPFFELMPGETKKFHTGIAAALPEGYYAQVQDRSGMASKAVTYLGGVIDSTYRGEWMIVLSNLSSKIVKIKHKDRIAQFMLLPVPPAKVTVVDSLDETYRGSAGFGGLTGT